MMQLFEWLLEIMSRVPLSRMFLFISYQDQFDFHTF